jgi:hypothetical protein
MTSRTRLLAGVAVAAAAVVIAGAASFASGGSALIAFTWGPMPLVWVLLAAVTVATTTDARRRRERWFHMVNREGIRALEESDDARAREIFDDMVRSARLPERHRAVAESNLGLALLRCGEVRRALALFASLERTAPAEQRPAISYHLALGHALAGDLDAAEAWRRTLDAPAMGAQPMAYLDAVIGLRRQKASEVAQDLEARWDALSGGTPVVARPLCALRAFALAQVSTVRDAGAADRLLATLRPSLGGELAATRAFWPEMSTFLAAHGL